MELINGFRGSDSGVIPSCIPAAHPLDLALAWLSRRSKLFSHGWGDEAFLAGLSDRVSYSAPPSRIALHWSRGRERRGIMRRDGTFLSPLELLPEPTRTVHVRAWTRAEPMAACVILAASRDEGFRSREHVFGGLVARGLDLYFLENPFYGSRRTSQGPSRITVSDHGLMALGMVLEARALLETPAHLLSEDGGGGLQHGRAHGGHYRRGYAVRRGVRRARYWRLGEQHLPRGLLSWSVDLDALGDDLIREHRQSASACCKSSKRRMSLAIHSRSGLTPP